MNKNNDISFSQELDISKIIKGRVRSRRRTGKFLQPEPTQTNPPTSSRLNTQSAIDQTLCFQAVTFRTPSHPAIRRLKQSLRDLPTLHSQKSGGVRCRLCQEVEPPMIRPCRCNRQLKFVHEECLKAQLLEEYNHRIREAECSECNLKYKMNVTSERLYMPKLGWKKSKDKLPLLCLVVFLLVLIVVIVLLGVQMATLKPDSARKELLQSQLFLGIFIGFCLMICGLLIWLIVMIIRSMMYLHRILSWTIHEFVPEKKNPIIDCNIEIDKNGIIQLQQQIQQRQMSKTLDDSHNYFSSFNKLQM